MEIVGTVCLVIGLLISLVYSIKLLISAFQTSIVWGLVCGFIPIIFVMMKWEKARSPFLRGLLAIPLIVIGGFLLLINQSII